VRKKPQEGAVFQREKFVARLKLAEPAVGFFLIYFWKKFSKVNFYI